MYTILVAVPENQDEAANIEETIQDVPIMPSRAELHVLNVYEDTDIEQKSWTGTDIDEFPSTLAETASTLKRSQFDLTLHRKFGNAVEKITETASEINADLIVVGGRKRSAVGKALFGSTAQSVILHTEIPVLIASNTQQHIGDG